MVLVKPTYGNARRAEKSNDVVVVNGHVYWQTCLEGVPRGNKVAKQSVLSLLSVSQIIFQPGLNNIRQPPWVG